MSFPNGMIGEIIKVLDMAGVEMLAISLPDSRIVDVTSSLAKTWACSKYEVIGQQLSQSDTSSLYAHYVNTDLADLNGKAELQVEIIKQLEGGRASNRQFKPKHHKEGTKEYLLLIGKNTQKTELEQQDEDLTRLKLAVEAGGYNSFQIIIMKNQIVMVDEIFQLIGLNPQTDQMSLTKWMTLVHPEDNERTLMAKIASTDSTQNFLQSRYRIKHKQGHYIWIELIARTIKDPISQEIVKLVGLCRDISEEMQQRHQIETSEQNLARSQALAKIGSWVMNLEDKTVDWSDQMYALVGIQKTSASSRHQFQSLTDLMDETQRGKWTESLGFAKLGQSISGLHCEFKHPDGEIRRISVHIDIEYDSGGNPSKLHGICQDITDQIMLERKFLQAQKMESVGQLTGGIAHDFNNLLMVVLGNLQLIEKFTADDEKANSRLSTAIDAVNKGSELTKRLLAFSRQQSLEDDIIDINQLIEDTSDMVTRAINSEIELKIKPGKDIWTVKADKTQLETAILNLSINARDAMKEGGALIIETENRTLDTAYTKQHEDLIPGDYVVISVSDTGHGMPANIIDKVLQPFFTTKAPGEGSGLGLSMIYGFVKQSKGHLSIYSEENTGTTIRIYLPRCLENIDAQPAQELSDETPPADQEPSVQKPEQVEQLKRQPIVLIAEDNDPVRDVAVAMIEDMGYIVLDAPDGEKALEIIKQRDDIDLLLSDVVMPGMNGPELAAAALEIRPELKVLFASGYTQGTAEEIHELPNFIELIDKPFTQEELTSKVRAAVESQLQKEVA